MESRIKRRTDPDARGTDSAVGEIVLVVVLVLDLWDLGAEKKARSFRNYFVPSL